MKAYIFGMLGMWLLCDGWFSLSLYIGKPGQGWLKDHSIRIIRIAVGVVLIVWNTP